VLIGEGDGKMMKYIPRAKNSASLVLATVLIAFSFAIGAVQDKFIPTSGTDRIAEDTGPLDKLQSKVQILESHSAADKNINWQVISNGGDIDGSSTNFLLSGTVGQTAVGAGSSDNFGLSHGFWQLFEDVCDCIPGDANGDGSINIGDAVYIIAYVFKGGPPPIPYAICSGDANCDCSCNVGDAVYLIAYVFRGGPAPCSCEQWLINCGPPLRK
jgi:hypothetical protein